MATAPNNNPQASPAVVAADKLAAKAEKKRAKDKVVLHIFFSLVLLLFALLTHHSYCNLQWASEAPESAFCDVMSSVDRYFICQKEKAHLECQSSMITFNLTLGSKLLIRVESVLFKPRQPEPRSTKIECFYRTDDLENSLYLNRYSVPGRHGWEIFYLLSTFFSGIATLPAAALAINPYAFI
jgi:hypothetical protein